MKDDRRENEDLREMVAEARRKVIELRRMHLASRGGANPQQLAEQLEKWANDAERLLLLAA